MIVAAALIILAVVIGHLLPGLDATEIDREIRNSLHVIGFAVIAAVIFEALPMRRTIAALLTLLLITALGALAEFAQSFDGKGFDLADLLRDVVGATIYVCARIVWIWSNADGRSSVVRVSARLASIVLIALLLAPLSYWLSVNARIAAKFPIIMDFEGRWDSYTYQPVNSNLQLVSTESAAEENAGSSMEILLLHRGWSGINVKPVVSDWSSYQFITMRAAIIGGEDSTITVDISDVDHPGFRVQHYVGERSVGPEPTVLRFPLHSVDEIPGRPHLDPANVSAVYIIAKTRRKGKGNGGEVIMILDDIRLE
jgi:VanZ family protein